VSRKSLSASTFNDLISFTTIESGVTLDVAKAVKEVKAGKIDFKVDKFGIIHAGIGKASFTAAQIEENVKELILTISKLKPSSSKGTYFKSIHLSSTMSPGIAVDKGSIQGI
jgi:large subunit ribosomal protein L1